VDRIGSVTMTGALPESSRDALTELLKRATVAVTAGPRHGTAFFFSDRELLTCWHVVEDDDLVTLTVDGDPHPASVVERDQALDVAVLRVAADLVRRPAVLLHDRVPRVHDSIVAWGFSVNEVAGERQWKRVNTDATSEWRTEETGETTVVELEGTLIRPGMSGGPVLNLANGGVVGILRYSNDPTHPEGGGSIPMAIALKRFASVRRALDTPARSTDEWQRVLGQGGLQGLGRDLSGARLDQLPGSTMITLSLDGDRRGWWVSLDGSEPASALSDLDATDIASTVFSWAQRRGSLTPDELTLLGRMLFRALMPHSVEVAFDRARDQAVGSVLLRLHFRSAPELRDVPWEYAQRGDGPPLACDEAMALVRVIDAGGTDAGAGRGAPRPVITRGSDGKPARRIRVLPLVCQPGVLQNGAGLPVRAGSSDAWPPAAKRHGTLRQLIRSDTPPNVELEVVDDPRSLNPTMNQFEALITEASQQGGIDILHLEGFGKIHDGQSQLAFREPFAKEAISWQSLGRVLDVIAAGGPPAVVVVQLGLLPTAMAETALSLSAFVPLLSSGVLALVGSVLPMHATLFDPFNGYFYAELSAGRSVEVAAQNTRKDLMSPHYGESLFGSFAVYTSGSHQEIRLVQPRPQTPRDERPNVPRAGRGGRRG